MAEAKQESDRLAEQIHAAPGTELLFDGSDNGSISERLHQLKHRKTGDGRMLLVPQPSLNDPNDPLNWSTTKKYVVFVNGCWFAFMGAITGPIMAAGMMQLTATFGKSLQELTYANGACLINQGVWNCVWMPFAVKYGRRPIYLFSNFLMAIACIWLAIASNKNYTVFIVGRAFLGAFQAPIESIVPSTVTDMFFLHNRGELIALYGLSVLGGNELGPMFSGFIVQALGMDWAFWIVAIFVGVSVVSMFFFMPETKYDGPRPDPFKTTKTTQDSDSKDEVMVQDSAPIPKKTFTQELKFWSRGDPTVDLLHVFLRPFVLLAYPTVLWSCCIYGMALSWNVILGASVAQLFAPPPYNFNSNAQGLFFLSPFIGSLFGVFFSGTACDWIANFFTKRNNGVREPEMRLPTCLLAAFFTFFGALWFGLSYKHSLHWGMPVVGAGILSVGSQMGTTLGMSYALDCHKELSVEIMVTIAALKSCIAWIWTWVINDYITSDGVLSVFMTVAAINVVVYLFCIPFYIKGKDMRIWLHRKDFLRALGIL
ncbi:Major facilitator superfamily domain general substrate transporter [Penicillium paradoxum]|uniref:Major facilitator superfamily domain general substrate transporter n=1 Tax=Penicillium paradoxum TaxID=176176 RepID=UPI0025466C08|nr:Major facilitator superfamily domain general substrate transporter [Penicillium paradoxum]KAJ5774896.1 Major facilitator superfamily domain general substrate transporter [Penicillium paradoxum]